MILNLKISATSKTSHIHTDLYSKLHCGFQKYQNNTGLSWLTNSLTWLDTFWTGLTLPGLQFLIIFTHDSIAAPSLSLLKHFSVSTLYMQLCAHVQRGHNSKRFNKVQQTTQEKSIVTSILIHFVNSSGLNSMKSWWFHLSNNPAKIEGKPTQPGL